MASIERELLLDVPAEEVWKAVSDEAMLRDWLAAEIELDLRPGGAVLCRTEDGEQRLGAVELVEEGERLAFRWQRDGAAQSRVEFRVEETDGGTRLTVTETKLEAKAAAEASEGWRQRLEALRLALANLAYA
jgi:uncharacterized protein YndB with AHSA1/START domain